MLPDNGRTGNLNNMPVRFRTEIRKAFEKEYIKVFLLNMHDSSMVKNLLESIECIHRVNISNDGKDLTAYQTNLYTAKEAQDEIETALQRFYSSTEIKKIFGNLNNVKGLLETHSKSQLLYEEAMNNISAGGSSRSTLDDVRLSLERYLQEVVGNKFTLEKQASSLKQYLKSKGATPEIITSITQSLVSFYKYQDNNVKHDSNVKDEDVGYFLNLANAIISQVHKYES